MWFWYGLASAVVGAVSVVINKRILKKVNASVLTWALFTLQIPFLTYLAVKDGLPNIGGIFWLGVGGSAVTFVVGKTLALSSIKQSVLSKVFPLMSLTTAYTYILGSVFLGETIRLLPSVGLVLIVVGVYTLNAQGIKNSLLMPFKLLVTERASRLYLLATVAASMSAIFDKLALTSVSPENPELVMLTENVLMSAALLGFMVKSKKDWKVQVRDSFWMLLAASLVYMVMGILVFSGFYGGPVVLVSGAKKLQVLFVLLLSWLFFGDKPSKFSWLGTVLMLGGVVIIKLL